MLTPTELRTGTSGMTAVGLALYESLVCDSSGFCVASVLVVARRAASSFPSASMSYATETAGVNLEI